MTKMMREYFQAIEQANHGESLNLQDTIDYLAFNENGLIPVVTQDAESHQVLMLAWMNKKALEGTLSTKRVTYWSRSRNELWVKGETSGHTQELVSMSFDCDGDTILCRVNQSGGACHTGRASCFYLSVNGEQKNITISGNSKKINHHP